MSITVFNAPRPQVVGHRGAPRVAAENTPAAFAAAEAAGATWVELDVRLAGAAELLVHHDPTLPDGTPIHALSPADAAAAGVHTLADVLAGLPAGLGVDLEVKNFPGEPDYDESMAIVDACVELVADQGERPLLLTSFNPMVLVAARPAGWTAPLGLLTIYTSGAAAVELAGELQCAVWCAHDSTEGLLDGAVEAAHRTAMEVMVWTVDDPDRVQALAAASVDAICTNDAAGVVATLGR